MAIQRRTVIKRLREHDDDVIAYFDPSVELLEDDYPYQVVISYLFARLENAHREALYYGTLKHGVEKRLAWNAIDRIDLTRNGFRELFQTIYGYKIPRALIDDIKHAEKTRDDLLHGRRLLNDRFPKAVLKVFDYFAGINDLTYRKSQIWIAGDKRGMMGARSVHSKATSRWILMGMGLMASAKPKMIETFDDLAE